MLTIPRRILTLLFLGEHRKIYWLVAFIVVAALFEMLGVASVLPFLSVISNPGIIETNVKLKWVYEQFRFIGDKNAFLIALGLFSFAVLFLNACLRAGVGIAVLRYTWVKRYIISKQLLAKYLYGPYTFFLNRNTSELTSYIQSEVARVVSGVLIPCLQIFSRSLLVILITMFLFIMNPVVAVVVIGIIGGGYGAIYFFSRRKLARAGEEYLKNNNKMYKVLHEIFGGLKEIKLLGKEHVFIEQYGVPTRNSIDSYCSQFLISQFPRYAFEVMAFGGILFATIYLTVIKKDYQQVIPLIGLYSFASYRLMPALQQIFQEVATIRFSLPAMEKIYDDYVNCVKDKPGQSVETAHPLLFFREIELRNITFKYPKAEKPVIEDLSLTIRANTTIGFVGGTGAGKTTLIDILLGLLSPPQGEIFVDGVRLEEGNIRMWQKNIGHVPQHIFLADDTVTRNIAFGVADDEIDMRTVQKAAQLANIHHFVMNELPLGYGTEVGERGIRLSGGQRQRIGIARAMYHDPSLLIFDEATSALDGITEEVILEAIHKLARKKTIIIIAHRLSTVKECDIVYLMEQGKIVDQGLYQELLANNEQFRKMAKITVERNSLSGTLNQT